MRRYILYYLLVLVVVAAGGIALSLTVFFNLEQIQVSGESPYTDQQLVEESGLQLGENLLRIDRSGVSGRLLAAFPYLEEVHLRLRLPNRVVIEVRQAVPYSAIEYNGYTLLLNEQGRVLEAGLSETPEGFLRVVGIDPGDQVQPGQYLWEEASQQVQTLQAVTEAIRASGLTEIDLVDLSDFLNIRLLYQNRLAIELGSQSDLEYKLEFAKYAIEHSISSTFKGTLDMSIGASAHIRQRDIHLPEYWPFLPELREEYALRWDARQLQ